MYKPLKIGNLTAKLPIIQGGMGVGISLSSLAGAVAAEGGIGVISTAQIGFSEPDFKKNPLETNLRMVREHIKRARQIAPKGILGVNIMVATQNYARYVKEAIKSGIDLIISGAGLPTELPEIAKGTKTKLIPIVSSLKAASVIFRLWDKKNQTTPDALIIEGPKAGGHLGFLPEMLEGISDEAYDEEIKSIIDLTKDYGSRYGKHIPVIIAGGIKNKVDMEHYLKLGADGIQVATKFVTTEECDADIKYKQAYLDCKKEDIIIVKSPVGMPGRAIRNEFVNKTLEGPIPVRRCHNCIKSCNPVDTPYCITEALANAAVGNVEEALLFCGANAYLEQKIRTVKEVLSDFF
ncbi:2-nitropropane dioxygenase [Anaerocolumna cellulosilytica]|uniref:Probable nitronate monooxygenase n=1 Tax=Anaerocolumna cellulosilytica TaxID=433286 RepID=A0A6S6R1H4_9FIRM|nr:nitronate monooxygenase family protein [Anaerocolumna cellulosilytica]MBB5195281.1 NAD(P)H-dependent flavin oxidoreductase YrpB (nitropropane dioxygenase family) [Anaerocolumna cellulosilytica]BCJ96754.1 2-nitropropane dioxygenase [Anaerocolumna cellulosilytica]